MNISPGGMFIQTVDQLPLGTHFRLSAVEPDSREVDIPVEVIWHREPSRESRAGMGLRFLNPEYGERLFRVYLARTRERKSIPPSLLKWAADTVIGKTRS